MRRGWEAVCVFSVALLSVGSAASAADPGLEAEIEVLKQRLTKLEERLASQTVRASDAQTAAPVIRLPSGLQGVELSGFIDTSYAYNFNEPEGELNGLRIFDVNHNSFTLHNLELNLGKAVDPSSPLGFQSSVMLGDDAEVTPSGGLFGGAGNSIDLQQAYVEYLAPLGAGVDLKAGKMATLIGAEVIESVDNWNFSRSFLFGFAIPFTHTGIRASYPVSETLSVTTGVNNGWDIADDVGSAGGNLGKGIEGQVAWSPAESFSVSLNGMFSPESVSANDHGRRWLGDIVASYQATDKLGLMVNYDYGFQQDGVADGDHATWEGVALYGKYDVSDDWALAGRYEYFHDADAFRTGSSLPSGVSVADVKLQELTLTSQHKIRDHLLARLEYRHDIANSRVFSKDSGLDNTQDTMAVELIMPF